MMTTMIDLCQCLPPDLKLIDCTLKIQAFHGKPVHCYFCDIEISLELYHEIWDLLHLIWEYGDTTWLEWLESKNNPSARIVDNAVIEEEI